MTQKLLQITNHMQKSHRVMSNLSYNSDYILGTFTPSRGYSRL